MRSAAVTVEEYLNSLPPERREVVDELRELIKTNLPEGYEEIMQYGMIGYVVPLAEYPEGYLNDKKTPLPYIGLAAQKNHYALYLMNIYGDPEVSRWFEEEYKASGKRVNMGKSCIRFRKIEDLPLDLIAQVVALTPVDVYIKSYENSR
ncbi:MAG: DUF1801 domain-containing protein [Candidatus Komeilibacteria bacterium]|nr:DUF1801 domain-containing protein [Candidatus Komeilibacteria bacterium]